MQKRNFIAWYYSDGVRGYLEIWKNFLEFTWYFFSVEDLFFSLFSPWKRDIVFKTWDGWNPFKSIEKFVQNIIFRFYGAVVRAIFILIGLIIGFLVGFLGLFFLICWLVYPIAVLILFVWFPLDSVEFFLGLSLLLLLAFGIIGSYLFSHKPSYFGMSFINRSKSDWFWRVYARLGLNRGDINEKIFEDAKELEKFLAENEITEDDFKEIVGWESFIQQSKEDRGKFWRRENLFRVTPLGKDWKYGYTTFLNRYCRDISRIDFTEYAEQTLIGHVSEFDVLKLVLEKPSQNSVVLAGENGVGKKAIIHYLAKLIRENRISSPVIKTKRIMLLDLSDALSSAATKGFDLLGFVNQLFLEASYAGNVILVIENIENYLGKRDNQFNFNIANVFEEFMNLRSFQIIATTTTRDYHEIIEHNKSILKNAAVVEVKELSEKDSLGVLFQNFKSLEAKRVVFTYRAFTNIVKRSSQIGGNNMLPQRAIDLAVEALMYWKDNASGQYITAEIVDEFIQLKTGIPLGEIKEKEKELLLNLEDYLHQRIIAQEEAVKQIAQALRKARSGIGNSQKPIGSFLFLGPTGVGKTETAKALAESYFGDENRMIRFDMSEFQSAAALEWMIGSTHLGQPGRLTSKVKDNPFSLILLDEIEKAHSDLLDIFLQILDEGYVNDAFGERVSFRNCIIIATSNAGASIIKDLVSQQSLQEEIKEKVIDYVIEQGIFRVEFLNRFDGVIFFKPLKKEELVDVAKLMLRRISQRIFEEKNIGINYDKRIIEKIIDKGYDPIFGARALNRYINNVVEDFIAKKIISQELKRGDSFTFRLEDMQEEV